MTYNPNSLSKGKSLSLSSNSKNFKKNKKFSIKPLITVLTFLSLVLSSFGVLFFSSPAVVVEANRAAQIASQLQNTRSQMQDVSKRRTDLEGEIKRMDEEIKKVEGIIKESQEEIAKLEGEIQVNSEEIVVLTDSTKEILKEMQVSGSVSPIEQVLSSQNLSEFLNQMYLFSSRHDKLEQNSKKLAIANENLKTNVAQQKTIKDESEKTKESLVLSKEEKDYLVVHFKDKEDEFKNQIEKLQSEQGKIRAQSVAVASNVGSIPNSTARSSSGFIWPAQGVITRCVVGGHIGCDIANPSSPPLYSVQSGTVSAVYRYTVVGYGLAVVVDHGGGLQTLYAHMSEIHVSQGQAVSQGQVLGRMGCTGFCSGTHVHFEVRQNGVRQDPLRYLPPR